MSVDNGIPTSYIKYIEPPEATQMTFTKELYESHLTQTTYYVNECFNQLKAQNPEKAFYQLTVLYGIMSRYDFADTLAASYVLTALDIMEYGKRSIAKRVITQLTPLLGIKNQANYLEVLEAFFMHREY